MRDMDQEACTMVEYSENGDRTIMLTHSHGSITYRKDLIR